MDRVTLVRIPSLQCNIVSLFSLVAITGIDEGYTTVYYDTLKTRDPN